MQTPGAADPADEEKRGRFAARANSILAFIECSDEVRPRLREAIVEAMLWGADPRTRAASRSRPGPSTQLRTGRRTHPRVIYRWISVAETPQNESL